MLTSTLVPTSAFAVATLLTTAIGVSLSHRFLGHLPPSRDWARQTIRSGSITIGISCTVFPIVYGSGVVGAGLTPNNALAISLAAVLFSLGPTLALLDEQPPFITSD